MKDEFDYNLYVLAELNYNKSHEGENEDDIYPSNWYNSNDYLLKIEIIAEALDKKVLIEDTDLYKESCLMNMFD